MQIPKVASYRHYASAASNSEESSDDDSAATAVAAAQLVQPAPQPSLKILDFSKNLPSLPSLIFALQQNPGVENIIFGVDVTVFHLQQLLQCQNLQTVCIDGCTKLSDDDIAMLANCKKLTCLKANGTQLGSKTLFVFSNTSQLTSLYCDDCTNFSDKDLQYWIDETSTLHVLHASRTALGSETCMSLVTKKFKDLENVTLSQCYFDMMDLITLRLIYGDAKIVC